MPRLTVGQLRRRIQQALWAQDIDDHAHHVSVYWQGVLFDARLDFSKLVTMPDGKQTVAYGLIFSPEGADEPITRTRLNAR